MKRTDPRREETMAGARSLVESPARAETAPCLQELFGTYHRLVFDAAYRVTGRHDDAEDVLQSVFLRLARGGIPRGLPECPGGYLRRAAVNAAIDLIRSRNCERRAVEREMRLATEPPASFGDPSARQEMAHLRRRVRDALGQLSARAAEMVVLRYFEGLSNREIAELLDTSEGTVGVTLHRARRRLRRALEQAREE